MNPNVTYRFRATGWAELDRERLGLVAVRLSPDVDPCGQSPYLFLGGKWAGQTVYVEPWKMEPPPAV